MRDIGHIAYSLDTDSDLWEGKRQAQNLKDDIPQCGYLGLFAIPVPPFLLFIIYFETMNISIILQ